MKSVFAERLIRLPLMLLVTGGLLMSTMAHDSPIAGCCSVYLFRSAGICDSLTNPSAQMRLISVHLLRSLAMTTFADVLSV